jgi:hypothetical protein
MMRRARRSGGRWYNSELFEASLRLVVAVLLERTGYKYVCTVYLIGSGNIH